MNLLQTLRIALLDLSLHKFRSALATLGIIFGVASVEAMVSISEGARQEALSRITVMGVDNVIVRSVKPADADRPAPDSGRRYVLNYGLLRMDLEHVRKVFPEVRYAVGSRNMRTTIYAESGRQLDVTVVATEPEFLELTRSRMTAGRFLVPLDQKERTQVCVIGAEAARKVFTFHEPLDQFVKVQNSYYRIVGILDNSAGTKDPAGNDLSNQIIIPLATAQADFGDLSVQRSSGNSEVSNIQLDSIAIQLTDSGLVPGTAARLENYLQHSHKLRDFQLVVPLELLRQKAATQRVFTIVMGSIGGLSLLIGGIGIMNIMLANVFDRRKEIGTRRALGARRSDIQRQFLLEAATLTTFGGMVGVGVGYLLARVIAQYAQWPTVISPVAIVLGLGISSLTGIVFGLWPARQAARTNPIEALRAD